MARAVHRLTARKVQTETKPGRHADGGGLYLVVDPGGAKRWAMLISIRGRRRELGIGSLSVYSLAEAREEAEKIRRSVARGEDPKKPKEPPPRFADAAEKIITELAPGWRGRDTRTHWERSLLVYAKDIGDVPIDLVTTEHVMDVVKPLWRSRPESGRKLRQRIETLLDAATVKGWREGANPARLKGHLERLLPKQPIGVSHMDCSALRLELVRANQIQTQIAETADFDWRSVAGFLGDYGIGNAMAKSDADKAIRERISGIQEAQRAKQCTA